MSSQLANIFSRLFGTRRSKNQPFRFSAIGKSKPRRRVRRALDLELLEGRVVPASPLVADVLAGTMGTAVVGTVYNDLDANGVRNIGENGVSGWTVYLDLDQSGTLTADAAGTLEPSAITDRNGDFAINHLIPGTYRVSEVLQDGWSATAPVSQDVVVIHDQETTANFFNFSGGAIVGTVWNDRNADGVRATDPVTGEFTDPGLSDWTVFLDFNNDRLVDPGEPTTLTDAQGAYAFANLPPNDYEVTVLLPEGWDISPGFDNRQTATVVARMEVAQDFAFFSLLNGSIQGTVWNDLNADGIRNTDPTTGAFSEPGLADWTVFLDLNVNGVADTGEPTTLTNATGEYFFISLPARDYEVTEVLPSGWDVAPTFDTKQTVRVRAGEATTGADFANFTVLNGSIRGTVWNDLNRNGSRDVDLSGSFTEPGLSNWTVYLDLNHNRAADPAEPAALTDVNGEYVFADLQVGDYDVREVLPSGWEVAPTFSDSATVTVYSGTESLAPDFANFNLTTATPGSVSGTVWNDLNGNGVRDVDPLSGAFTDPGLAGWTVFVDLNSNGAFDPSEPTIDSAADGSYSLSGIPPGTVTIIEQVKPGWRATAPSTALHSIALRNGENATGLDFGNWTLQDATIRGVVFADANKDGVRSAGERGLDGITVYLDLNTNEVFDAGEPQTATSVDLYYTPAVDEAGTYSFTHLAAGTYVVRVVVPALLSATPAAERDHSVTLTAGETRAVDCAAVFRPTEIHGIKFDDADGDHLRDAGEPGVGGITVFVDLDRDDALDVGEPTAITLADGSYSFTDLPPGAYVIREVVPSGYEHTYPTTTGGTLWPTGVSNPAVGDVTPTAITTALATGETFRQTVSLTLPGTGALTNLVDVFLLFDDTGSFVSNSPIVRAAFPDIIAQLQASLPGIDLGFGVGRFEEYGNFGYEYATGRPFILNQPIVAASTTGYLTAIQAALNRTTPGYGGDQPETDIEALYQLVTGLGFDGNNNGSVLDSGLAGLAATQLNPGPSGDVPSFASFTADPANNVLAAAGTIGGGGFRAGALPIILVATDTGFAFQPRGETTITGVGGLSLPISALTGTSRPTTPFDAGAGIQQTITGLNALGALVIGLGTNAEATLDPRQGLEALSSLTGAVNRSTGTIANGTANPIAPGDPLYFQIASGFAGSVANGVVTAIQNAVTNVAVDITIQASDPRVRIVNHTGVLHAIGSGQTATFDIEFVGDGVPRRFDVQFVRAGTNVVLGSIPVVIGTPIPGDCYEFEELTEGEIHSSVDFGSHLLATTTTTPTIAVTGGTFVYDAAPHAATATATGIGGVTVAGTFSFTYNGATTAPTVAGVYNVVSTFTSSDPNYSDTTGSTTLTISAATPTVTVTGGTVSYDATGHGATAAAVGVDGVSPVAGSFVVTYNGSAIVPTAAGIYEVVAAFTSSDPNYADATASTTLTISAATPTVTVTGGTFSYDATGHGATAAAVGVDGVTPVAGSLVLTYNVSAIVPTAAGTYDVVATFTSSDPNYTAATATGSLTITPALPVLTLSGGSFSYDGTAHSAVALALGVDGVTPISGSFSFTYNGAAAAPSAAGTYSVAASFTSSDPNYSDASASGSLTISPATPVFSNLSAPTIAVGVESVVVSGHIAAGAVCPTGQDVSITMQGVTHTATVDSSGAFGTLFLTSQLPLSGSPYAITFSYPGDAANFRAAVAASSTLTVVQMALEDGLLDIAGTVKSDRIRVDLVGGQLVVTLNGQASRFALADVDRIRLNAGAGNDQVTLNAKVLLPTQILGNSGNDTLTGGGGNDLIVGGAGKDTIKGGAGNDILDGVDGNDDLGGGSGLDHLYGGAGDDALHGNGGNDRVAGGDGRDQIHGDDGNDFLFGDAGNDALRGDAGDDHIRGGAGNDLLNGGGGTNQLDGDDGTNVMRNGNRVDLDLDYLATLSDLTGSGAVASAFYEADTEMNGEERLFELTVTGLSAAADAEVYVYVDGDLKGELALDESGSGRLVFREVPANPEERPFPEYFDIIATSTITLTSKLSGVVLLEGSFLLLPSDN